MKLQYLLPIWILFNVDSAHADIYKRVDAEGHVTYSSVPLKGARKLHLTPLPVVPPRSHNQDSASAANFPKVDSETQKGRDNTRKQILDDELATEEKSLAETRVQLQTLTENPVASTDADGNISRSSIKQDEKISSLQDQIQMHEKNIAALKTELSKINK